MYSKVKAAYQKQPFADVFKIGVLKNFSIFKGKHLCWGIFSLLKTDSNTDVFL